MHAFIPTRVHLRTVYTFHRQRGSCTLGLGNARSPKYSEQWVHWVHLPWHFPDAQATWRHHQVIRNFIRAASQELLSLLCKALSIWYVFYQLLMPSDTSVEQALVLGTIFQPTLLDAIKMNSHNPEQRYIVQWQQNIFTTEFHFALQKIFHYIHTIISHWMLIRYRSWSVNTVS